MSAGGKENRTEPATEKYLRDAEERGATPPDSRYFSASVTVFITISALLLMKQAAVDAIYRIFRTGLTYSPEEAFDVSSMLLSSENIARQFIFLLVPLLFFIFIATAFILFISQPKNRGFFKKLLNKSRFNKKFPIPSKNYFYSNFKFFLVVCIISTSFIFLLYEFIYNLSFPSGEPLKFALTDIIGMGEKSVLILASVFFLTGLIDVIWLKYIFSRSLRMSQKDIREEIKETAVHQGIRNRMRSLWYNKVRSVSRK